VDADTDGTGTCSYEDAGVAPSSGKGGCRCSAAPAPSPVVRKGGSGDGLEGDQCATHSVGEVPRSAMMRYDLVLRSCKSGSDTGE
jgi:hypothetical protein